MIRGVHHISLATGNLDKLLWFYHELLGMELKGVFDIEPGDEAFETVVGLPRAKGKAASLFLHNLHMEVFAYDYPAPRLGERRPACDVGIRHIAFDVTDLDAEWARLKAAGIEAVSEPIFLPAAGCKSIYMYDPDGNICELQERLPGTWVEAAVGISD